MREFQSALADHDIVVMDAFATWCGPCKTIAPTLVKFVSPSPFPESSLFHELAEANGMHRYSDTYTNAHFIKVDVDDVPDVAQELGVRAMPTFIIFKGGEKVGEVVGMNPPALQAAIEKVAGKPVAA